MHTIITPLDGSALAEEALPVASELGAGLQATLYLVRVVEPARNSALAALGSEASLLLGESLAEVEEQRENEARVYLEAIAHDLRERGLRVTWEVRVGRPADEVARLAETTGANLIVMATHGRSGVRRLAFGSVTNDLLQRGIIPVLAIPPRARAAQPSAALAVAAALA